MKNTTIFPLCRQGMQKKFMKKMRIYLGTCSASPTEVVFSGKYEWLLDADGEYVNYQPEGYMGRYVVVDVKYEDFKERLSEFCTEREIARVLRGFRNYNGYLAAADADRPLSGCENDGN